jgi:PAS domain S-box-containing protein
MATELRKTGISVVGDVPWGTHFCHFYETKQDLLDTLVPYFKAGLEGKEFCVWVVSDSELITVEEAKGALKQAVPNLDRHLADEDIEISSGLDWYLEEGVFNLERVTRAWDAKLRRALDLGYDGMRVSGDTFWLAEKDWKDFFAYEKQLNESITDQPMTVLCTYPLAKTGADEVLDVVQAHQFAIARRQGEWEVIETPALIQAKAEINRLNEELEQRVIERTRELAAANLELRREITERKHAEDELGQQKEILQKIFDHIPVMINFVAADGHIKLVNREWERVLGWTLEEIWQQNLDIFAECYPDPAYRQEVLKFVAEAKGEWVDFKTRVRDGRVMDTTWVRVHLSDGTSIGIGKDITDRKEIEDALRQSEERFAAFMDNLPGYAWMKDLQGRYVYVNETVGGLPGYRSLGKTDAQIWPADLAAEYRANDQQVIAAKKPLHTIEHFQLEGKHRYMAGSKFPIFDKTGAVALVGGVGVDITERIEAQEAVRRSEEHLRLVIDTIPVMAWSVRPDGVVDFVNQRWTDFTGLSLKEETEEPTRPIHPEDVPRVMERWLVEKEIGEPYEDELRLRRADGRYRWFLVRTAPLRDEQGNLVKWYGVSIDIEDRKRAEEQLNSTTAQLRALSASLQSAREEEGTRIAREIHDELGGALTSLKWDLESLHKVISETNDPSLLQTLHGKVEAMLRLSETTIGAVRRISSELRPSVLDDLGLAAAIEWQAQQFQTRTGIICHCEGSVENLDLDRERSTAIFRILQEALTNILRHAQATRVEISIRAEADEIVLTVRDNGRGITADDKSRLQSLGLLGMRERAHLIGGAIEIIGVDAQGTLVTVRVPNR